MSTFHTHVSFCAFILNYVDLTSQFECLPNGEPITYVPRSRPAFSPDENYFLDKNQSSNDIFSLDKNHSPNNNYSPDKNHFLNKDYSPERTFPVRPQFQDSQVITPPATERPLRIRSRSPPPNSSLRPLRLSYHSPSIWNSSSGLLGYKFEQVEFLRLIPKANSNLQFVIRKYTLPSDKAIQLKERSRVYEAMPTEEKLVLSTSNADVLAVLDNSNTFLRGIFKKKYQETVFQTEKRVKINMHSGDIKEMTKEEIEVSPLGKNRPILKKFEIILADQIRPRHSLKL